MYLHFIHYSSRVLYLQLRQNDNILRIQNTFYHVIIKIYLRDLICDFVMLTS